MSAAEPLLRIENLEVAFDTDEGLVKAVDGVSFDVHRGEMLGIVGESGSGKSVANMTILGLTRASNAKISGRISFEGQDLIDLSEHDLRAIRGSQISMIFQDPLSSLHPFYKVGKQLVEAIQVHQDVDDKAAMARAVELLGLVVIQEAERRAGEYPHEFSGGMRQRAMIAMALTNDPKLLIADEPTTALDVTTQAQILDLMKRLQDEFGSAIIMITHDLGVVAEVADDVVVMYAARVQEEGEVRNLFRRPNHPYTWGLLGSLPHLHQDLERLVQISGQPPSLLFPPKGCRFHPRCSYVMPICSQTEPELAAVPEAAGTHRVRCHLDQETKDHEAAKLIEGTLAEVS